MIWFIPGLIALILGAELMVRGSSKLALALGITPLVVGRTVVAFGTSAPEMAVSVQAAWSGRVDIALGNVVGSNIINVLAILGISALIVPLVVHRQLIRQEVPVMIGVSLLAWAFAADGGINRWEGFVFIVRLAAYTTLLVRQSRRDAAAMGDAEALVVDQKSWDSQWGVQVLLILVGLALLVLGANWLVEAAVTVARLLGISEMHSVRCANDASRRITAPRPPGRASAACLPPPPASWKWRRAEACLRRSKQHPASFEGRRPGSAR